MCVCVCVCVCVCACFSKREGSTARRTFTFSSRRAAAGVVRSLAMYISERVSQLQTQSGEFIVGRVIRAMSQCWHPTCFKCVSCHCELADVGFVKNQGRSV